MNDFFSSGVEAVFEALSHPWLRAAVVVIAAVIAARILDVVISRILIRLTLRTDTDLDDRLIELLHRPVFISVILVGLWAAVRLLKLDAGCRVGRGRLDQNRGDLHLDRRRVQVGHDNPHRTQPPGGSRGLARIAHASAV